MGSWEINIATSCAGEKSKGKGTAVVYVALQFDKANSKAKTSSAALGQRKIGVCLCASVFVCDAGQSTTFVIGSSREAQGFVVASLARPIPDSSGTRLPVAAQPFPIASPTTYGPVHLFARE